jgi:hypothetical protein
MITHLFVETSGTNFAICLNSSFKNTNSQRSILGGCQLEAKIDKIKAPSVGAVCPEASGQQSQAP